MSNNTYQKVQMLCGNTLPRTMLTAIISVSLVGCSVFNTKGKSSDKGRTDPKSVKSEPTFHHGFGGDPDTFKLIDRMDTRELANLVKDEEAAKKIQTGPKPSLIYTGKSLGLKDCSIAPKGADHIAEIWRQEYLLGLFIAPGLGIQKAIESLQESDAHGIYRPFVPVHVNLAERLKDGVRDDHWVLNAIRFRIADPSSVDVTVDSDGGLERQAVPVMGQIKLNYELDRYGAKTDPTIASASFIHSIAINQEYIGEFIKDVFSIKQEPANSGCEVLAILNKYIRSQGLKVGQTPRGSYFFLHTNIFDTRDGINEWRFTEHKLVTKDLEVFSASTYSDKRSSILREFADGMDKGTVGVEIAEKETQEPIEGSVNLSDESTRQLTSGEITSIFCPKFIKCPKIFFDSESQDLEKRIPMFVKDVLLSRGVKGAHDSQVNRIDPNLALRIVPMSFPKFYVTEDFDHLKLATDKDPLRIWFSGTLSDFGKNPGSQHLNYNLVSFEDGTEVPLNHPVRRHEETKTCAQCHASSHDTRFNPKTLQLNEIASMNFRHIGFGDGGNRRCNPFFGLVRAEFNASLSTYLLKTANGFSINGYSPVATRSMPLKMEAFAAFNGSFFAQENGIDMVRCFNVDGKEGSLTPGH